MAQEDNTHDYRAATPRPMRVIFGIIMIIIYIGMGIILLTNSFHIDLAIPMAWARYVIGVVLVVYGIWRGYRQFSGRY